MEALGEAFSVPLFIFGPKYRQVKKDTLVLINFIFASAKLAIWKSRKNKVVGEGFTDPLHCLKGLITAHLRVEHAFYKLTKNMDGFITAWGIRHILCSIGEDDSLILKF